MVPPTGPIGDLNADFAATGSVTIDQLDDAGYDIVINDVNLQRRLDPLRVSS